MPLMSISNTINHDRWRHFVFAVHVNHSPLHWNLTTGAHLFGARSLMRPWSIDSEMITIDVERSSPSVVGPWREGWYGSSVRSIMITSANFNAIFEIWRRTLISSRTVFDASIMAWGVDLDRPWFGRAISFSHASSKRRGEQIVRQADHDQQHDFECDLRIVPSAYITMNCFFCDVKTCRALGWGWGWDIH